MSIYKVMISYENENGDMQYHVVHDITPDSMVEAIMFVMDNFFDVHGRGETKKVVVELQQSMGKSDGKI